MNLEVSNGDVLTLNDDARAHARIGFDVCRCTTQRSAIKVDNDVISTDDNGGRLELCIAIGENPSTSPELGGCSDPHPGGKL